MLNGSRIALFAILSLATLLPRAGISRAGEQNGVVMKDGKTMMLEDGKPGAPLDHEMTLQSGAKVMPDGKVMTKDGKQMKMRDGTIIMNSGRVMHGSHAEPMMPPDNQPQE